MTGKDFYEQKLWQQIFKSLKNECATGNEPVEIFESRGYKEKSIHASYNWKIDPLDRSWVITTNRTLMGGLSHAILLQTHYKKYWDELKDRAADDYDIEYLFTKRLLLTECIIICEYDDFHAVVYNSIFYYGKMNALQGFAESIMKARDVNDTPFIIHQVDNNKTLKSTVKEIARNTLTIDFL